MLPPNHSIRSAEEVRSRLRLVFDLILSYEPDPPDHGQQLQAIDAEAEAIANQAAIDAEALAGVEVDYAG